MAKIENVNTEQLILEAAEDEFLEKGYSSAKTTAIAKRAGVTHAMLHYYFRTKENLFQMVFQQKVQMAASSFEMVFKDAQSLEKTIREFVERHFEFISRDPRLITFVYNEVIRNKENQELFFKMLLPRLQVVLGYVELFVNKEVAKGTMRPVKPIDLLVNSACLNIATFMIYPIAKEYMAGQSSELMDAILSDRKESNVQFILNAVKI